MDLAIGSALPSAAAEQPRAAEYVRMSTEHQRYSTSNQRAAIRTYAEQRGIRVVESYCDEGKSGLRLSGRDGLERLLADVSSGRAMFELVLVYDVSRWGRFQDADESAYYEYVCKRAGIRIVYCAEQFENDGSIASTIVKSVKRAMAGEYSRELSTKVFAGHCRLVEAGFRQGGPAPYGLRRVLLDGEGRPQGTLLPGQRKSLQSDRVILVPGPEAELAVVRRIFQACGRHRHSMARICRDLQQDGIPGPRGGPWTMAAVKYVLRNPVYTGSNVYNRLSFKLKRRRIRNGPDTWIRGRYQFAPIIPPDQFERAQVVLDSRRCRLSDEELIAGLADLRRRIPRLSAQAIDRAADLPTVRVFTRRFGSLTDAYGLAGAPAESLIAQRTRRAALRQVRDGLIADLSEALAGARVSVRAQGPGRAGILIDGHLQIRLVLAVMRTDRGPGERWRFGLSPAPADLLLLVPLRGPGLSPDGLYCLPPDCLEVGEVLLRAPGRNGRALDAFYRASLADLLRDLALLPLPKDLPC
ncbi:MAG: recombinase family protein [Alphaproteobacteria bacterium]|nr:recombinase family protein [Alphaproteobacteria bacterium]